MIERYSFIVKFTLGAKYSCLVRAIKRTHRHLIKDLPPSESIGELIVWLILLPTAILLRLPKAYREQRDFVASEIIKRDFFTEVQNES